MRFNAKDTMDAKGKRSSNDVVSKVGRIEVRQRASLLVSASNSRAFSPSCPSRPNATSFLDCRAFLGFFYKEFSESSEKDTCINSVFSRCSR